MALHEKLKEIRLKGMLSQRLLGDRFSVSYNSVYFYELGKRVPVDRVRLQYIKLGKELGIELTMQEFDRASFDKDGRR